MMISVVLSEEVCCGSGWNKAQRLWGDAGR